MIDLTCPHCQQPVREDSAFCGSCGAELPPPAIASEDEGRARWICPSCGVLTGISARFCGACGSVPPGGPVRTGSDAEWWSHEPGPARPDGSIDLGFLFPTTVWEGLDTASTGAYEVYASNLANQWGGREEVKQFGYMSIKDGLTGFDARRQSGIDKIGRGIVKSMHSYGEHAFKAHKYSPLTARYFHRSSILKSSQSSATFWVLQLTYVRSMQFHRYKKDVTTYPPAPISNLIVAVVPGRAKGSFACNLEQGQFAPHPRVSSSPTLLDGLNAHILPVLQSMWAMDYDVLSGDAYRRTDRPGPMTFRPRWLSVKDGEQSLEPLFSPTLFQTDVLNPAIWHGSDTRMKPSDLRAREFAMGILPYGNSSLLITQYPTSNVFDRQGVLLETHLLFDTAAWIMDSVANLLQYSENADSMPGSSASEDLAAYIAASHGTRQSSRANNFAGPMDNWQVQVMGKWLTTEVTNHPVLPLELLLHTSGRNC